MMGEAVTRICWAAIVAIHLYPSLPLVRPALVRRLYGVDDRGALGLLLSHRAALFAIVVVVAGWAIADPGVRGVASVVAAISMASFLALYARFGRPAGPLRTIAIVDAVGLAPLAWVTLQAWGFRA